MNNRAVALLIVVLLGVLAFLVYQRRQTGNATPGGQGQAGNAAPAETAGVQLLDFYADWCGPCQTQKPIVHELERQFPNVTFRAIDVDKESALAAQYKVSAIPTLVILVDGRERKRFVGVQSGETLAAALRQYGGT